MFLYLRYAILLCLLFYLTDCATYWNNRRKDAQDVFTAGVENPAYGIGFRISYFTFGFHFVGGESELGKKDLGEGYGLRGGSFAKYHSQQLVFAVLGGESFYSGEAEKDEDGKIKLEEGIAVVPDERDNLKSHKVRYIKFYNDPPIERQKRAKDKIRKAIAMQIIEKSGNLSLLGYIPAEKKKPNGYPVPFPFQVEIFSGIYYSARIGFNAAEFLDFFLGFFGADILEDDTTDSPSNSS